MHYHFIGVNGSGVSGVARLAYDEGYTVSGCDLRLGSYAESLSEPDIKLYVGHSPDHLDGVDAVVYSGALSEDNSEIQAAKERGIPLFHRAEFLFQLMEKHRVIGVTGTHGKTTTTWMLYHLFTLADLHPTCYAGGKYRGKTAYSGAEPWIVELDESDGSVFSARPQHLIVTNIEPEHVDFYQHDEQLLHRFEEFIYKLAPRSLSVGRGYSFSDRLYELYGAVSVPTLTEIRSKKSFYNINGIDIIHEKWRWLVRFDGKEYLVGDETEPPFILQNRMTALVNWVMWLTEHSVELPDSSVISWDTFAPVYRRFEYVGHYRNVALIDDYAHHPTEVSATISAAERTYRNFGLLIQPHRYTRLTRFFEDFISVLRGVEPLFVVPVFAAGEVLTADLKTAHDLFMRLKESGAEVYYFENLSDAREFLSQHLDTLKIKALVSVGAGDANGIVRGLSREV